MKIAIVVLAELLGMDTANFDEVPTLQKPSMTIDKPFDVNAEIKKAMLRPDMQRLVRQMAAATANVEAARGALYPTLSANGQLGYSRNDDVNYENDDKMGSVGVAANWDFDVGGAKRAALAEAKSSLAESRLALKKRYDQVCSEIRQESIRLKTAFATLALFKKNTVMAKRLRDMEEERYRLSDVSITRLNEVQTNFIRTKYREEITYVQLLMAIENIKAGTNVNVPKESTQ